MKIKLILLQLVVFLFLSCESPERNNPFDPECPKEIWSPTTFQAIVEGNSIRLTWSSPSANFTGFKITKRINNGSIVDVGDLTKNITQMIDNNIVGGKPIIYSIVAYAGNNVSYSLNTTITPVIQAIVSTISPSLIGTKTVTISSTIISNGGASITERGFCWSTNTSPTNSNSKVINMSEIDNFSETLTGLNPNSIYYVRAYAINSKGISYGNEISFTTKGYGTVTDIDNNIYITATIGSQVWMVENLKTTKYKNGGSIPNITSLWGSLQNGAYCCYSNNIANKNIYGALYNFFAVNTGNLAPNGWHVPTNDEWLILINYLGGYTVAGGKMKEAGFSHWASPNTNATNESGFKGLPGGSLSEFNDFYGINTDGNFWSSSSYNGAYAYYVDLTYSNGQVSYNYGNSLPLPSDNVRKGFSVRCVKD